MKKIVADTPGIEKFFVKAFLNNHPGRPKRIVLDLDVTDNELHGKQEGRFFHGHYDCYCYLPLYIYCGDDLLCAKLRSADVDPAEGVTEELDRIVGLIRNRWKHVQIVIRGDSGFCREQLLRWCEENGVFYVIGLQRNTRLVARIKKHLRRSCAEHAPDRPAFPKVPEFLLSNAKELEQRTAASSRRPSTLKARRIRASS